MKKQNGAGGLNKRTWGKRCILAAAMTALATTAAHAAFPFYPSPDGNDNATGSGDWFTAANWSGAAAPRLSEVTNINGGQTLTLTSGNATTNTFFMGNGSNGALNVNGGSLTVDGSMWLGQSGSTATLTQTAGDIKLLYERNVASNGTTASGTGNAVLSIGQQGTAAGSLATVNMSGGTFEVGAPTPLAYNTSIGNATSGSPPGGTLEAGMIVGGGGGTADGKGILNLSGNAQMSIYNSIWVGRGTTSSGHGAQGTINIQDSAILNTSSSLFGGGSSPGAGTINSTINQSGGTINVGTVTVMGPWGNPVINGVPANAEGSMVWGYGNTAATTATYTMSAGTLNVNGQFYLGGNAAAQNAYTTGGAPTVANGYGSFIMHGGTVNVGADPMEAASLTFIGNGGPSTPTATNGTLTLDGSTALFNAGSMLYVGNKASGGQGGTGVINISDGKLVAGGITMGLPFNGSGTAIINFSGGTISIGSLDRHKAVVTDAASKRAFNWTGGNLDISSTIADDELVNAGGVLRPGGANAIANFSITNSTLSAATGASYRQTDGETQLEVASNAAYDSLTATPSGTTAAGAITLTAGNVRIMPISGFTPAFGTSLQAMTAKSITDTATWITPALTGDFVWDKRIVTEGSTQMELLNVVRGTSTVVPSGSWSGGSADASYKFQDNNSMSVDAGGVTVGQLQIDPGFSTSIAGPGAVTFSTTGGATAGIVALGGTHSFSADVNFASNSAIAMATPASVITFSGAVSGSGTVEKAGPGTMTLNPSSSSFSGTWSVSAGTFNFNSDADLGAAGASMRVAGGTINVLAGGWNSSRAIQLSGSGMALNAAGSSNLSGPITGSGGLTKIDSNLLNLANTGNNYTGTTTISAGTLQSGGDNALSPNSALLVAATGGGGVTVDLNGHSQSLASLASFNVGTGTTYATVVNGADLTVGANNTSTTFRGYIDLNGTGNFHKTGTGITDLQAYGVAVTNERVSINAGAVFVDQGTLQIDSLTNFATMPTCDITIASGATLSLNGSGTYDNSIHGGGKLQIHALSTTAALFTLDAASDYTGGTVLRGGTIVLTHTDGNGKYDGLGADSSPVTGAAAAGATGVTVIPVFASGGSIFFNSGDGTFSHPISTDIGGQLTFNSNSGSTNITLDQPITGNGTINFSGTNNTYLLTAHSTYNGLVTINNTAVVKVGIDNALSSAYPLDNSATLDLNGFNQAIGSLVGTGKVILSSGKTLSIGADNFDNIQVLPAAAPAAPGGANLGASLSGFTGTLTGPGNLTKTGAGLSQMVLSNTAASVTPYTGETHVAQGELRFLNDARAVQGSSDFVIDAGAALTFNLTTAASGAAPVISAPITGGGKLITNANADTLELTNTGNTYSGGTIIGGGTLIADADSNLGASTGNIRFVLGGTSFTQTLQFKNAFNTARPMSFENTATNATLDVQANNVTASGILSGAGGLTKIGTGTLTLTGASTFSGPTTITAGAIVANSVGSTGGSASALGVPVAASPVVTMGTALAQNNPSGSASLMYTGSGETSNRGLSLLASSSLVAAGGGKITLTGNVALSAYGLTLDGAGNGELAGVLSGIGGVTAVNLTNGGTGYSSTPTVTFTGGGGSAAAATASRSGTTVSAVAVSNIGSGYTSAPTVGFTGGGGGTGAAATAVFSAGTVIKEGTGTWRLSAANTLPGVVTVNNGTLEMSANQKYAGISVNNTGKAKLIGTGTTVLSVASVASSGTGQVDVANNKLIDTTAGAVGAWNSISNSYSGISGQIASGRAGATWSGPGIVTSQTNAALATQLTTLGVATAGSVGKTTFGGVPVSSTDTLVMYTYNGDANLDGKVNADDYFQIDSNYNKTSDTAKSWLNGDFNYDGRINGDDYALIDSAFAGQGAVLSAPVLGGVSAVPEPACGGLLTIAAAGVLSRRRRRG